MPEASEEEVMEPVNLHELCRAMDEFVAANNARLKALADRALRKPAQEEGK